MPTEEINTQPSYPEELIQIAKKKGYKAANLEFLDKILLEFSAEEQNNINIVIPKHISISNQAITDHIDQYSFDWKEKWDQFCELQGNDENLKPEAIAKLKEIQVSIRQAFIDKTLEIENLDQAERWMVRSTGDEDRVDVANPGGNESVPSDSDSISSSIGIVIASYFSEKSMSQRLKSGEEITKKPPLMPCLIQKLVGEKPGMALPPVSGVIYTDTSGNIRIQAAYGHGELVVNSKGNFDNIFVTKENVVHQYLGDKKIRLVPRFNLENKQISLEEVNNSDFSRGASLDEEVSMNLAKFANFVQSKYGMRMDLEFVFDPNGNTINIVQARPIPEGKRKALVPSALSNDFIATNKPLFSDGQIITPDVMTAKVIISKAEILVCDRIDEALNIFLKDKDNKFKAVITKNTAPDTSHEAGFFASQAIPVMSAEQYDLVKSWIDNFHDNILIIDPQHASIYQIKQNDFQENLIEEGVFRSPLAPFVTPIKRHFTEGPSNEFPQITADSIGELVIEARNNPDATQKLFRFVHDEMGIQNSKAYDLKTTDQDIKQLLNYPVTVEDFHNHREILAHLLNFVTGYKNEKEIAPSTYEQLIITGMELHKILKEIESNPQDPQTKKYYLDIHQKFKGLMTSEGAKDILSTSVRKEIKAHDEKLLLKQEAIETGFDLSLVSEEAFLNLARNKVYLFRDEDQQKWLSFCYSACQKDEAIALQTLVKDITSLDLKDYWMNINFLTSYNNDQANALSNLQREYAQNLAASEDILKARTMIDRLEHQINQWSEPKNFKKLFEQEFKKTIAEINPLLRVDDTNKLTATLASKQLYRLIDAIDLSIKQLQNSHLYEDKEQQVNNFRMMLGEFFSLINQNVNVNEDRLALMQNFLSTKLTSNQPDELLPSIDFSVINADFFQDSIEGFDRGFTYRDSKTLADLHTLIHQTLLGHIARKSAITNQELMNALPEFVKTIHSIASNETGAFANYQFSPRSTVELLYIDAGYPYISIFYKVPLNSHSGTLKLEYNLKDKNIKLDYTLFGSNPQRWKELEEYGFLLFEMFTDAKIVEHKADNNLVNLQLTITPDNLKLSELFKIFNTLADSSLDDNAQLSLLFSSEGNITKMLEDKGLSEFILNASCDSQGKLDFIALHQIIEELKNSTGITQKTQEIKALLRLMAMDNANAVNPNKLKLVQKEFKNSELDFIELVSKNSDKFSDRAYSIITAELVDKVNMDNILSITNIITANRNTVTAGSSLTKLAILLIDKGHIDEAIKITEKVIDQRLLARIAGVLIDKDNKIAEKITYQNLLIQVAIRLNDKDQLNEAVSIGEKITITEGVEIQELWKNIAIKLINNRQLDEAISLIARKNITDQSLLSSIAIKLIDNNNVNKAISIAKNIIEEPPLLTVAMKLINNNINEGISIADKITNQQLLEDMVITLIDKGKIDEAISIARAIRDQAHLFNIATTLIASPHYNKVFSIAEKINLQDGGLGSKYLALITINLIENNHIKEAMQIAERITDQIILKTILDKVGQSSKVGKAIADIISSLKNPTILEQKVEYLGQANKFSVKHDLLKIPDRVAAAEISSVQSNILQHNHQSILLDNVRMLEITRPINMPNVRYIAENTCSQIALASVVGHMISNVSKSFSNFFNNGGASSSINQEAKDIDKKLLSLGEQFKALHDKRVTEYDKSPSKSLLEEINNLKALQDTAIFTLERLENFNKLDKEVNREDLQREANKIWKSYKKLKEAKEGSNFKGVDGVYKATVLEGLRAKQSEIRSVATTVNTIKTQRSR